VKLWVGFLCLEEAGHRAQGREVQAAELEARGEALEQAAGVLRAEV